MDPFYSFGNDVDPFQQNPFLSAPEPDPRWTGMLERILQNQEHILSKLDFLERSVAVLSSAPLVERSQAATTTLPPALALDESVPEDWTNGAYWDVLGFKAVVGGRDIGTDAEFQIPVLVKKSGPAVSIILQWVGDSETFFHNRDAIFRSLKKSIALYVREFQETSGAAIFHSWFEPHRVAIVPETGMRLKLNIKFSQTLLLSSQLKAFFLLMLVNKTHSTVQKILLEDVLLISKAPANHDLVTTLSIKGNLYVNANWFPELRRLISLQEAKNPSASLVEEESQDSFAKKRKRTDSESKSSD